MKKIPSFINRITKKKFRFLGMADSDGHIFGIKEEKSQKMITRFIYWDWLSNILSAALVFVIVGISPLGGVVMKRYLMKNPQVMITSLQEMDRKERDKSQTEAKEAATKLDKAIADNNTLPVIGNKNGANTVIVFYDYACTYCKKASKEMEKLLARRTDVKVVLQDFPVLSMNSLVAAKASLFVAKNQPEKLHQFHFGMFDLSDLSEDSILKFATKIGIKGDIAEAMKGNKFEGELKENYNRGSSIRVNGTPVFVINGELFVGYITADQMEGALKK